MSRVRPASQPLPSISPEIDDIFASADYTDVHWTETSKSLADALFAIIRWQPVWLKALYLLRTLLAPLFGYRIVGIPPTRLSDSAEIPFIPGEPTFIGKVWKAVENEYWSVEADDRHLKAILLIRRNPTDSKTARLSLLTVVFYKTWRGRFYLRLVMLFHHKIVNAMLRAAV